MGLTHACSWNTWKMLLRALFIFLLFVAKTQIQLSLSQSSPPPTFPIISNLSDIWLPDISSQIRVLLLIDFSLTRRVSNFAAPATTDVALMERATELQGSVVAEESKAPWSELNSKLDLLSRWLRSSSYVEVIQGFVTLFCDWLDLWNDFPPPLPCIEGPSKVVCLLFIWVTLMGRLYMASH